MKKVAYKYIVLNEKTKEKELTFLYYLNEKDVKFVYKNGYKVIGKSDKFINEKDVDPLTFKIQIYERTKEHKK